MSDLDLAIRAAHQAGQLLRSHFGREAVVDEATHHDIKLALDKESQEQITKILLAACPGDAIYGEEGLAGNQDSERQWIVDPIDGTVNYYYGIPHFCVSIALRIGNTLEVGVIHDPMVGETWAATREGVPTLNGRPIKVSDRTALEESILFVGCGKDAEAMTTGMERFQRASHRARKMRMMGSAALGMAYIASGRLDGYIESRISLWDIAAGQLILERAGGVADLSPVPGLPDVWSIVASNGKIPVHEIVGDTRKAGGGL